MYQKTQMTSTCNFTIFSLKKACDLHSCLLVSKVLSIYILYNFLLCGFLLSYLCSSVSYSYYFCLVRIFLTDSLTLHLLYSSPLPTSSPCVYEMRFLGFYDKVLWIHSPKYSEVIQEKLKDSEMIDK